MTTGFRTLFFVTILAISLVTNAQTAKGKRATKPAPAPAKKAAPVPEQTESATATDTGAVSESPTQPEKSVSNDESASGDLIVLSDYWQPGAGKHGLVPYFSYLNASGSKSIRGLNYDFKDSGTAFGLKYMYGLSDNMAIGVRLSTATSSSKTTVLSTETETKYDGLSDAYFRLVGKHDFNFTLHYGLGFGLPLGDRKYNSTDRKYNNYSGGYSVVPNVGISGKFNKLRMGADLGYTIRGERKTKNEPASTETTTTGGNQWTVTLFGEMAVNEWIQPGVSLEVGGVDKAKNKTTVGGTTVETESDQVSLFGLAAYSSFKMTDALSLVPMLGYVKIAEDAGGTIGTIEETGTYFEFQARFSF